jgi:hypothetical protein
MRSNTPRRIPALAAILAASALGLILAASAWAGPGRAPAQSTEPQRVESDGGAGLQVAVDPQTGKVRQPTPEEIEKLSRSVQSMFSNSKSLTSAAQPVTSRDGTVGMAVGSEYLNVWVVRINPDGSASQACLDSAAAASSFFAGAPAAEEK